MTQPMAHDEPHVPMLLLLPEGVAVRWLIASCLICFRHKDLHRYWFQSFKLYLRYQMPYTVARRAASRYQYTGRPQAPRKAPGGLGGGWLPSPGHSQGAYPLRISTTHGDQILQNQTSLHLKTSKISDTLLPSLSLPILLLSIP